MAAKLYCPVINAGPCLKFDLICEADMSMHGNRSAAPAIL